MDFRGAVQFGERGRGVYRRVQGLPAWARLVVFLAAVPGIVLVLLSVVVFIVSILALFLLTIPVYRALALVTGVGGNRSEQEGAVGAEVGRRQVNVRVIE
jgi:hypothetical protein